MLDRSRSGEAGRLTKNTVGFTTTPRPQPCTARRGRDPARHTTSTMTPSSGPFRSLYSHGFVRVASAVPHVRVAEPAFNAERTLGLAQRASDARAGLVIFPELGISAYSIDDLLHQEALLDAVLDALRGIVAASAELMPVIVVGAPLEAERGLFNTAVVIHRGRVLGVVPKSYLPEYREYYEKRQFRAARDAISDRIQLLGSSVPFGADLLFSSTDLPELMLHVEVCEDFWVPIPPSTYGAMAGATVLANLSASNITIGKADYRRLLCAAQSARTVSGYVFTAAGMGESTTDLAWDGQAMIFENGEMLAQAERFAEDEQLIFADIDLERIVADRSSTSNYGDSIHDHRERLAAAAPDRVRARRRAGGASVALRRRVERFPYVPADPASRSERCEEVYNIQVRGLETRLRATGIEKVVIGVSGGLDSTHALIVAVRAIDRLGLPRTNVLGYTMPGFATSKLTLSNAHKLMQALGVSARGDRHPPLGDADAARPRPPGRARREGLRHHLRERAGGRAHLTPVPPRQPPPRVGARDRRSLRARARLEHLRRR